MLTATYNTKKLRIYFSRKWFLPHPAYCILHLSVSHLIDTRPKFYNDQYRNSETSIGSLRFRRPFVEQLQQAWQLIRLESNLRKTGSGEEGGKENDGHLVSPPSTGGQLIYKRTHFAWRRLISLAWHEVEPFGLSKGRATPFPILYL